jgi:hypothetical protein
MRQNPFSFAIIFQIAMRRDPTRRRQLSRFPLRTSHELISLKQFNPR